MEKLIDQLGLGYIRKNRGYALSGGERRRVEIARALCIQPKFILLDEPFSGIDPIAVLDLQKIISDLKASGIGVLITDHNVRETLSVTDRAYIINEGRIFRAGTPEQLGNDPEVKRVYLGESFSLGLVRFRTPVTCPRGKFGETLSMERFADLAIQLRKSAESPNRPKVSKSL